MKLLLHQVRAGGSLCLRGTCNFELIVCSPGLELSPGLVHMLATNKQARTVARFYIDRKRFAAVSYAFQLASTIHRLAWSQLE
jgi:hypothetical protein